MHFSLRRANRLPLAILTAMLLLGLADAVWPQAADELLVIGKRYSLTLDANDPQPAGLVAARRLTFAPKADGPFTVTVESCVGDVLVCTLGPDDQPLLQDDNGFFETNARLLVPGRAGEAVRLQVAFLQGGPGPLDVTVTEGDVPAPQGRELNLATAQYLVCVANHRIALEPSPGRDVRSMLIKAGDLYYRMGECAFAREPFERAARLAVEVGDKRQALIARCFVACIEQQIGDADSAVGLLRSAATDAAAAGIDGLDMFVSSHLGLALSSLWRLDEAEAATQHALDLTRKLSEVANEAAVLQTLVTIAGQRGQVSRARDLCQQTVALAEQSGDPDVIADALIERAGLHEQAGATTSARADLLRALELAQRPGLRCRALGKLSQVEQVLQEYGSAQTRLEEALELARSLQDSGLEGAVLLARASLARELGQLDAARDDLEAALPLLPTSGSNGNSVSTRMLLGSLATEAGDNERARELNEEALQIAHDSGDPSAEVAALLALAMHLDAVGDPKTSWDRTLEGLKLARESGRQKLLGDLLLQQAHLARKRGTLPEAHELVDESLAALRSQQEPTRLLPALTTLAEIALDQKDTAAAAAALAEAEAIVDRPDITLPPELLSGRRSTESLAACGQLQQDLTALRVRGAKDDAERRTALEAGLASAGRWKARGLLEGLVLHADVRPDALGELSVGAEGRLLPAESGPGALARAQAALHADDVLVEFAEGRDHLYAYVLHGEVARFHDLGPRAPLQAVVDAFVADISDPPGLSPTLLPPERLAADGQLAYAKLLKPLLDGMAPEWRLIIVPSATVAMLPFEALVPGPAKSPRGFRDIAYVIDQREVTYAPSTPVLALLAAAGPRSTKGRVLMVADASYPATRAGSLPRSGRSLDLQRLPGTRTEAVEIARRLERLLAGADAAQLELPQGDDVSIDTPYIGLRLGDRATPAVLQGDLQQYALLHFATHGYVDARDARWTGMVLTPGNGDDGFVSTGDVLSLRFDADLAVLSACSTARGRERRGEGTQSLARAFLYAGARSVVSSLWQVDDRETERLMTDFYQGFAQDGRTASAALREARLAMRNAPVGKDALRGIGRGRPLGPPPAKVSRDLSGHPYFWAAFTYVGPPDMHPLVESLRHVEVVGAGR